MKKKYIISLIVIILVLLLYGILSTFFVICRIDSMSCGGDTTIIVSSDMKLTALLHPNKTITYKDAIGLSEEPNSFFSLINNDIATTTYADTLNAKATIISCKADYIVCKHLDSGVSTMNELGCTLIRSIWEYDVWRVNNSYYSAANSMDEANRIMSDSGISLRTVDVSIGNGNGDEFGSIIVLNDIHEVLGAEATTDGGEQLWGRYNMFVNSAGVHSADNWQIISAVIDALDGDSLVIAADLADYTSKSIYKGIQIGFDKISTPIMYLMSDHDYNNGWGSYDIYSSDEMYSDIDDLHSENYLATDDIMVQEEDDYIILGWSNSHTQMTKRGLDIVKKEFAKNKPIILVTHVPLGSIINTDLDDYYASVDPQSRHRVWRSGCFYEPDAITQEFLDLVLADDSPVKAVFAGHLHLEYTTQLTDSITEYVLAPSYSGNICKVNIVD